MGTGDISGNSSNGCDAPVGIVYVLSRLHPQVLESVFVILSVGVVLAMLEVIYLAFVYPGSVSTVAGIIAPLVAALIHLPRVIKRISKKDGNS